MRFYFSQPLLFYNFQSEKRATIRLSRILAFISPTKIYLFNLKFRIIIPTLSMSIPTIIITSHLLFGGFIYSLR